MARWTLLLAAPGMLLVITTLSAAPAPDETTWSDGITEYRICPPVEGYFVSRFVLKESYEVPLKKVLAVAHPMTRDQLRQYGGDDGGLKETDDYPMLVFKNQGVNLVLWKGRPEEQQEIFPRVFDGSLWSAEGTATSANPVAEGVFYRPPEQEKCYVLIEARRGSRGPNPVRTERVLFGKLPPPAVMLKEVSRSSDVVVHASSKSLEEGPGELLDCLKGSISRTELRAVPGAKVGYHSAGSYLFLTRVGGKWKLKCSFTEDDLAWHGPHGGLTLSVPGLRDALEKDEALRPYDYTARHNWRWRLAREAAAVKDDESVGLRVVNPKAGRGEWIVLEFIAGKEAPANLFTPNRMRGGGGGGHPLVEFRFNELRRDKAVEITPRGRAGWHSFAASRPEESPTLECEYRFIPCSSGVLKLALLPKVYPWEAEVRGILWSEEEPPYAGGFPRHQAQFVRLAVK